jgi:DNA invertase Pin-like site-specific DNA recombinase
VNFVQNPDAQEQPLRDLISQRRWDVYRVYPDWAGAAEEILPGLDALMEDARRGLFDVVVFWSCDRFARSVKQLVLALEELRFLGIAFVSYQEGLDTSSPMGTTIFTLVAAMSEVERCEIQGRIMPGMDNARTIGSQSGKSPGRPRKVFRLDTVLELRAAGFSWRQIATFVGAGITTIRRAVQLAMTCGDR